MRISRESSENVTRIPRVFPENPVTLFCDIYSVPSITAFVPPTTLLILDNKISCSSYCSTRVLGGNSTHAYTRSYFCTSSSKLRATYHSFPKIYRREISPLLCTVTNAMRSNMHIRPPLDRVLRRNPSSFRHVHFYRWS